MSDSADGVLLTFINYYLKLSGASKAVFGRESCGDSKLIYELNAGRQLRKQTRVKVLRYISQQITEIKSAAQFLENHADGRVP